MSLSFRLVNRPTHRGDDRRGSEQSQCERHVHLALPKAPFRRSNHKMNRHRLFTELPRYSPVIHRALAPMTPAPSPLDTTSPASSGVGISSRTAWPRGRARDAANTSPSPARPAPNTADKAPLPGVVPATAAAARPWVAPRPSALVAVHFCCWRRRLEALAPAVISDLAPARHHAMLVPVPPASSGVAGHFLIVAARPRVVARAIPISDPPN